MSALTDLQAYATVCREIKAIEGQLERLLPTGEPSGIRAIGGHRGTNDPTAAAMQRADGIEGVLRAKREGLYQQAKRGERALELLADPRERYVMRSYYMLGMSDARIAEGMYRSRSDVQRIRKRAEAVLDGIDL